MAMSGHNNAACKAWAQYPHCDDVYVSFALQSNQIALACGHGAFHSTLPSLSNKRYYQRIESGTVNLSLKSLNKLAKAFRVSFSELMQLD